jgi:integrase
MYLFLLIALNTAARKHAILSLRWERIDMTARRIDFRDPDRPVTKKRRVMVPHQQAALARAGNGPARSQRRGRVFKHHTVQPTASLRTFASKWACPG